MLERLDKLAIKLCENLPLDFTIFERNGFCIRSNKYCDYYKKNGNDSSFCYKKTYTLIPEFKD